MVSPRHGRPLGGPRDGHFASAAVNSYTGLIYGNVHQFLVQVVAAGAALVYAFVVSYLLARVVDATIGLRVSENEDMSGSISASTGSRCEVLIP